MQAPGSSGSAARAPHRLPSLQAGRLEDDTKGAIAHNPVGGVVIGLPVGPTAGRGLEDVAPLFEVAVNQAALKELQGKEG